MKKALFWCSLGALILIFSGYIVCLFTVWNAVPLWRTIIGVICHTAALAAFTTLLFTIKNRSFREALTGFRFEVLELAFVSLLLSFVIVTV